jgi:TFIIF-interacting CTD phosphatase-like protein
VQKRPGVEAFLLEMGRRYEVVIYTDEAAMYADPVINKIDPHRAVTYRLYRGDTQVGRGAVAFCLTAAVCGC